MPPSHDAGMPVARTSRISVDVRIDVAARGRPLHPHRLTVLRASTQPGVCLIGASDQTLELASALFLRSECEPAPSTMDAEVLVCGPRSGGAAISVSDEDGSVSIWSEEPSVAQLKVASRLARAAAALRMSELLPLHACIISDGTTTLAICGPSGSGKSHTARALQSMNGFEVLVVDWCLLDPRSGTAMPDVESSRIVRGDHPSLLLLQTEPLEIYEGDPFSPFSRHLRHGPEPAAVENRPLTNLAVIESATSGHYGLAMGHEAAVEALTKRTAFMLDEALDGLTPTDRATCTSRLRTLLESTAVRSMAVQGHRTSTGPDSIGGVLVAWARLDAS